MHCFILYFWTGSQTTIFQNGLGIQVDLSWFSIVSSIISIVGMLNGGLWITKPIQHITDGLTAKLTFFPLFLFRMMSWLMIITFLESFTFFVLAGLAILNSTVLLILQKSKLTVDPIVQSMLSLAFPIIR
jgi:hypothetical protein